MQRVTRRAALAGGVLAAGGGAAIAVGQQSRGRRWLHGAGLIAGPDLQPPSIDTSVSWRSFPSRHMHRDVGIGLYEHDAAEALLVCLHGRGASHRFAFDSIGIDRFVAAANLPWTVVSADGGSDSYWHPRRNGTDAQAMVLDELIPLVISRTDPMPVLLLGWSMGGFGALIAACERPALVVGVAAASPAVWRSFDQAAKGAFDDERDFDRHDLFRRVDRLRTVAVRIDCGRDDPFAANDAALARDIPGSSLGVVDGFHDAPTWRTFVPEQLAFLQRALRRS